VFAKEKSSASSRSEAAGSTEFQLMETYSIQSDNDYGDKQFEVAPSPSKWLRGKIQYLSTSSTKFSTLERVLVVFNKPYTRP
jgi:hypothetical protein